MQYAQMFIALTVGAFLIDAIHNTHKLAFSPRRHPDRETFYSIVAEVALGVVGLTVLLT